MIIIDSIDLQSKKTSDFTVFMKNLDIPNKKTLILLNDFQENLILSSRNIRNVFVENVNSVSVYDLLDSEVILIEKEALKSFSEVLA